ncbi:MAG: cytochrome c biosis protein CcmH [Actinomycetota bacterium]
MNRVLKVAKGPLGWLVLLFASIVFLAVGVQRDSGPSTPQERIDAVSQRLACPTCDGESVYESRGSASIAIKREVARLVSDGQLTDGEIVRSIEASFGSDVLLVPRSSGLEGLVWALPVAVAVVAVVGMGFVFRRWRRENRSVVATDDDEVLVASARRRRSES